MKKDHSTISQRRQFIGRAPARLDVMGGIADYSGSLVLQMPLNLHITAKARQRTDGILQMHSGSKYCQIDVKSWLACRGRLVNDKPWKELGLDRWCLYIVGCLAVLMDSKDFEFQGLEIGIYSTVPLGVGISSSAALENACLVAFCKVYQITLGSLELPLLAQRAENLVVGAPCGAMDQLASYLGRKDHLLPILCQPARVETPLPLPPGLHFCGLNTGSSHHVGDKPYTRVRVAAFMGLSIILQDQGLSKKDIDAIRDQSMVGNIPFDGYLANITPEEFEIKFSALVPLKISGKDFLNRFGNTTDTITVIEPEDMYCPLNCTRHPIYENHRITRFAKLIYQGDSHHYRELGELMLESHESYRTCGLSSMLADNLVDMVVDRTKDGLYGARITGGGSAGTVCIIASSLKAVEDLQNQFQGQNQCMTQLYLESSEGAQFLS